MRVGPATNVARINVSETITALWTFAHANGISLDDIIERTAAAGVTIDGLLVKDAGIRMKAVLQFIDFALATDNVIEAFVVGDSQNRFILDADGGMGWGPGNVFADTNLFRDAPNVLKTDDDLHVGGVLAPLTDIEISESTPATITGTPNHNFATGTVTVLRLDSTVAGADISGFAGGRVGRLLMVINTMAGGGPIDLLHNDGGSTAANRMLLPGSATLNLSTGDGVLLWYDDTTSRWRAIAAAG